MGIGYSPGQERSRHEISDVPWYMVLFDKKSIKPFQLFVLGKGLTLFPKTGEPLEWLRNAILANPARSVQPYWGNPEA
jgi:hypothetical protein